MKEVIKTTTGELSRRMILNHCGDYAGRFQDEAFDIFQEAWDTEIAELDEDEWMDIMFDGAGNVYAVDAEGELTCQNADCYIIQLGREDCPEAFNEMEKRNG